MAAESEEKLVGVLTSLRIRTSDYDVLFTDRRLIAARTGSSSVAQIAAGMAGHADLGSGDGTERYVGRSFDDLVRADPRNIEIPYQSIRSVRFNAGISMLYAPYIRVHAADRNLTMILLGSLNRKDRAQISQAKGLLSRALGPKASFKHV